MSAGNLNLSRRPFVNSRPVTRVAVLLWLLGVVLLLGNVFVYLSYVAGTGEKRDELAKVEAQKQREQRDIRQLNERFASLDLAGQNEQVDFLNEKIDERTFSWSVLFDRLSRLLPDDVRLTRLSPHGVVDTQADRRRRGAPAPPKKKTQDGRVTLTINGEAKSDTVLLKFVDNLFADPAFLEPDLQQEVKDATKNIIKFDLRVGYLPRGAAANAAVPLKSVRTSRPLASAGGADTAGAAGAASAADTAPGKPGNTVRGTAQKDNGGGTEVPPSVGVPRRLGAPGGESR